MQEVETRISSLKEEVGRIKDKVKELRASRQDQEKLIAGHEVQVQEVSSKVQDSRAKVQV